MIFYIISDESTAFSESPAIKITGDSLANFPHVGPAFTPDTLEQAGPVHLTSGNTIRFRCEIQGAPPSKLTWVKVIHQKEFLISCIDPNHKFNHFPVTMPFMPVPFYMCFHSCKLEITLIIIKNAHNRVHQPSRQANKLIMCFFISINSFICVFCFIKGWKTSQW